MAEQILYIAVHTDPKIHTTHQLILTNVKTKESVVMRTLEHMSRREAIEYAQVLANTPPDELGRIFKREMDKENPKEDMP